MLDVLLTAMATPRDSTSADRRWGSRLRRVAPYLLYLVVTSVLVFIAGFVTTALGTVIMTVALVAFGGVMLRADRNHRTAEPPEQTDSAAVEWFRPHDLLIVFLACLPAVALPAEVKSPMASFVFFMLFAIPVACIVLTRRAFLAWNRLRLLAAPPTHLSWFDPMMPPPGWYDDPVDPRSIRWWDGVGWTQHWAPSPPRQYH